MKNLRLRLVMVFVVFLSLAWLQGEPESLLAKPLASLPDDVFWDSRFTTRGVSGVVQALAVDGSDLYVAGDLLTADDVVVNGIAKWDGSRWTGLGDKVGCDTASCTPFVRAVDADGGKVYIGGYFNTVGSIRASAIAVWDGNRWSALGNGVSGRVNAIAISGNSVYVGGYFSTAGSVSATNVAKWDGSSWSALGGGLSGKVNSGEVLVLEANGNDVYAGGYFDSAGGIIVNGVAKWDGNSWSSLGNGVSGCGSTPSVHAIAVDGNDVFVGGCFDSTGGVTTNSIAKWNGTAWSALGNGFSGYARVNAIVIDNGKVYAGGSIPFNVAVWDGNEWSPYGMQLLELGHGEIGVYRTPIINALAISGSALYVGGEIDKAGNTPVSNLARWDADGWSAVGNSASNAVYGYVTALAVSGDDVYIGGNFNRVGDMPVSNLVKWNTRTNTWSPLGDGFDSSIFVIAINGQNIYVGGAFTSMGNLTTNGIVKWDGTSWSPLGNGVKRDNYPGYVHSIAIHANDVYVGGYFTAAGDVSANNVAKWNGSNWSALGNGLNGNVNAMAIAGDSLYVGGKFFAAGSLAARGIAKWNGSSWSTVGSSGISGFPYSDVNAIAVAENDIYIGGIFNAAGARAAVTSNIAKWDGSNWSAVGGGLSGPVYALASGIGGLYAGGNFTVAGNVDVRNIVRWDGERWLPLGSGADSAVHALAVNGEQVYVGGDFGSVGGKPSPNFARWSKPLGPWYYYFPWVSK